MRLDVEPRRLVAQPQQAATVVATVTNTGDVIAGYAVGVLGADPGWVQVDPPELRLFPAETATVAVTLRLPDDARAGEHAVTVQVRDVADPGGIAVQDVVLDVPPAPRASVRLDPPTLTAGTTGAFSVLVRNDGNTLQLARLVARDPEAATAFTFRPETLTLPPGQSAAVALEARARRPLVGDPRLRPFELRLAGPGAPPPDAPPAAAGVLVQKPRFTRGVLALAGLLVALTTFAVVITVALGSVVSRSAADRNLALQVAQAEEQEDGTGTSALAGTVTDLATGAGVGGLTVAAFGADPAEPVLTTATGDTGEYTLPGLPAGDYTLRVEGAGFTETWFPAAPTQTDAQPVTVQADQTVGGLDVVVGGVPATLAGTVTGTDVAGAVLTVELPLDAGPLAGTAPEPGEAASTRGGAVVRTVPVGAEGTFDLADLPSPGVYDLVVTKEGFSSTVQRVDLAAGEERTGVQLALVQGDGSVSGTVSGLSGPLAEATVVASSAQVTVETVTLSQDPVGSFVVRGLPTPGTYTVVVSAAGHASETLNVTLTPGQALTGLSVVLGRDEATLGGRVVVEGGSAAGVDVTVTDGALTLATVTQSTDPVGAWRLSGLRVPGTYTVTFSRDDLEPQVLSVSLDAFGAVTSGAGAADAVDVTLRAATARVVGTVRQEAPGGPRPVGNVRVTVSAGDEQRVVHTSSTPRGQVGRFVVAGLAPGTYTVTFARSGTRATSEIVVLTAGQEREVSPTLVAPARVHGTVTYASGTAGSGLTVLLYRAQEYGTAAGPVATTTTDTEGGYAFDDVDAPASYLVEVRTTREGQVLGTSPARTLEPSEQLRVDLELD